MQTNEEEETYDESGYPFPERQFMIANGSLLVFLLIIITLKIVLLIKSMKEKKLQITIYTMVSYLIQKTIFIYLDHLDLQIVESQSRKNTDKLTKSQSKELKTLYEYDGTIICNCYECFCEGCPWYPCQDKCSKVCCNCLGQCCILSENCWNSFQDLIQEMENYFLSILKYVIYFVTKPYFYMILNLFFINTSPGAFITIGVILYSLNFYVLFFTTSFFSTKREMMRLEENDRGLLVYYHIRKAFIYTFFLILSYLFGILVISLIINKLYQQLKVQQPEQTYQIQFIIYNSFFLFIGSLIQLILLNYNPTNNNTDLIQDNDHILKAQQRLYIMQNNLIKYFPSQEKFYEFVLDNNFNDDKIDAQMKEKCQEAKLNFEYSFQANQKQKFKKIKKNLGQNKSAIITVSIWLYIITYSTLISSVGIFICYHQQQQNQAFDYLKLETRTQNFIIALFWFQYANNIILPLVLPYFYDKKDLFGQDYGALN